MNCPAAPRLEATVPDSSSSYAEEGTLAHAYCALKLKAFMGLDTSDEAREISELNERYHSGEMDEYTDTYKTIVLEKYGKARTTTPDAQLLVETRLDFSEYVPEAFGTSDATIIADGTMEIIDFKYGKGVKVSAIDNEQMKIYALGAYLEHSFNYIINRVRMTIVQPRIDNLSEAEISADELMRWADEELKPRALEAYRGSGAQRPGTWCQFCKVKCSCRALADASLGVATDKAKAPELLSPEEIAAHVLPMLPIVRSWLTSVEDFTLQQALSGVSYPGYKLVEGRSVRRITNEGAVIDLLDKEGYGRDEFMKPAALCGIGDLEKLVGKKRFGLLCADYITKPAGKPTLVTDDDKRPAIDPSDDFKDIQL